jgi:hypothetical protein
MHGVTAGGVAEMTQRAREALIRAAHIPFVGAQLRDDIGIARRTG